MDKGTPPMTCVIMGNGPSLLDAPKELLEKYPTWGCNYVGEFWQPNYYVVVDRKILDNWSRILPTARGAQTCYLRNFFPGVPHPAELYDLPNARLLQRGEFVFPGESTQTGGTSTYIMMKLAYFFGYSLVYLVGVDHSLEHFTPNYPHGVRPDFLYRERHYRIAAEQYKKAGKRIVNLSAPSVLNEIFQF